MSHPQASELVRKLQSTHRKALRLHKHNNWRSSRVHQATSSPNKIYMLGKRMLHQDLPFLVSLGRKSPTIILKRSRLDHPWAKYNLTRVNERNGFAADVMTESHESAIDGWILCVSNSVATRLFDKLIQIRIEEEEDFLW